MSNSRMRSSEPPTRTAGRAPRAIRRYTVSLETRSRSATSRAVSQPDPGPLAAGPGFGLAGRVPEKVSETGRIGPKAGEVATPPVVNGSEGLSLPDKPAKCPKVGSGAKGRRFDGDCGCRAPGLA